MSISSRAVVKSRRAVGAPRTVGEVEHPHGEHPHGANVDQTSRLRCHASDLLLDLLMAYTKRRLIFGLSSKDMR